ncbi:MAG: acyloxyacyl hydrolase, partial [Bacteroidetes bacterium]|nr:acyloxyacyl hydrolase [Bacteroidota bacterium]
TPTRQARGFIFSDNAFGGVNLKCAKHTWIDLRIGFRHISNAGLREPNGGVNNLMLSGGFIFDL